MSMPRLQHVDRFRADLEQRAFMAHIEADLEGGLRSGVTGVPTFFINGFRHVGSYRPDQLLPALDAAGAHTK